jgi:hypothetical protein
LLLPLSPPHSLLAQLKLCRSTRMLSRRRSSDEVKKPALSVVVLRRAGYDAEVIRLQLVGVEKPPVSQLPHGVAAVAGCHHYPELGIVVLRRAGYGGEIVVGPRGRP